MASTNKTVNYELSQFEGTDKPSWEADYNADMLAIDTNMKAISDVADGASGSISTLADRVTTAEGNISTNANDIDALEARADALESGETIADGRLDALEAEQIIQNTSIEGVTRLAYTIAEPYDSTKTYERGDLVIERNTLYRCNRAITTGEEFTPSKWVSVKVSNSLIRYLAMQTDYVLDNDCNALTPNSCAMAYGATANRPFSQGFILTFGGDWGSAPKVQLGIGIDGLGLYIRVFNGSSWTTWTNISSGSNT